MSGAITILCYGIIVGLIVLGCVVEVQEVRETLRRGRRIAERQQRATDEDLARLTLYPENRNR